MDGPWSSVLINGEKGELLRERELTVQNTSDEDSVGKEKVETLVHQISFRKYNKHTNFIGKTVTVTVTVDDITITVDRHIYIHVE